MVGYVRLHSPIYWPLLNSLFLWQRCSSISLILLYVRLHIIIHAHCIQFDAS